MRAFLPRLLLAIFVLLSGCSDAADLLNKKLEPVSNEEQRAAALANAAGVLANMEMANVGANLRLSDLSTVLMGTDERKRFGVTALSLSGDQQLLKISVSIDRAFASTDFPDASAEVKGILDRAKPKVKGTLNFSVGLTSETSEGAEASANRNPSAA